MLKFGIPFLLRLVVLTVVIETGNSEPRSISTGLSCLGVEMVSKSILLGKHSTIDLEIVLADTPLIHPEAQTLVPNELSDAYGLVDGNILVFGALKLVLVDQHYTLLCLSIYLSIMSWLTLPAVL